MNWTEQYVDPTIDLTVGDLIVQAVVWGSILIIYLLRKKFAICAALWYVIKIFFYVLLAILLLNYAKKEIKEWWSK